MRIAAMDGGIVKLFWIRGQDGGMLAIDTNKIDKPRLFRKERILAPF